MSVIKKAFVFIVVYIIFGFTSSFTTYTNDYQVKTIVIDAGHGGKDPGCHGKNTNEKQITLQTALELGRIIKENLPGVKVIYTRDKDEFIELHDRASIANKNKADLFISLHCNSGPTKVYGTETYVMGLHTSDDHLEVAKRENAVILQEQNYKDNYGGFDPNSPMGHIIMANYQNAYLDKSINLAAKIEKQFKYRLSRNSRGVKQAGLLVLWKTYMPSVLVEIGFLTNLDEEKFLNSKTNRVYVASCIYRAVKEYKNELNGK